MKYLHRYVPAVIAVIFILSHFSIYGKTDMSSDNANNAEVNIDTLIYDLSDFLNANNNLVFITNTGSFGRDHNLLFGRTPGWYYPFNGDTFSVQFGSDTGTILYDAGLVLTGKVNGTIRTALAIRDITEFVPGPLSYDTTFPDLSFFEVLKLDTLSSPGDYDYDNWLIPYGAPVDSFGDPNLFGEQTLWAIYNDGDSSAHTNPIGGGTDPLGVEVHQTVYGSSQIGEENFVFLNYKFFNKSSDIIDSFYISLFFDPDIGGPNNDLIGCDSANELFFCYNSADYDSYYQFQIPAWGGKIISGPVVHSPGDTAQFYNKPLPDYKNIGMSSVVGLFGGNEPITPEEIFLSSSGLECKTGSPLVNPITGDTTKFYASGNPVRRSGWVDTVSADKKLIISFGPLTFNPGDSQQVAIKLGAYIDEDRLLSLSYLRNLLEPSIPIDSSIDSTDYQPIDSIQFSISDFGLNNVSFEPSKERWLTGYNWGGQHFFGGVDYASELFGSALDTLNYPDSFHYTEIRFSNIEKQKAYRYLRGVDTIYSYAGYYEVPFTVWDIDNNRQLNVAFVEDVASVVYDSTWSPDITANMGGYEYLFIFNSDYSGEDPYNSTIPYPDYNIVGHVDSLDILYIAWLAIRDGYTTANIDEGHRLVIDGQFRNHNGLTDTVIFRSINPGEIVSQDVMIESFAPGPSIINLTTSSPDILYPSSSSIKYNGYSEVRLAISFAPNQNGAYSEFLYLTDSISGLLLKTIVLKTQDQSLNINEFDENELLPEDFVLYQNYPNPFNPNTKIKYSVPNRADVKLNIYNILGRKVKTLRNETQSAGWHEVLWDGTDDTKNQVASGIYFYRIEIGNNSQTRKMLLLR